MEVERLARSKERKKRRNTVVAMTRAKPEYDLKIRSCSLSYLDVIQSEDYSGASAGRIDRFSMPPLTDHNSNINIEQNKLIYQT